jgi:hypothetical protein
MANRLNISWARILAEGSIIVVSILLAFGIQAWWDDLARSQDEFESLLLIQRDLVSSIELLEEHVQFSERAALSALDAYAALSGPGPYDRDRIHHDMLRVDRVTLKVPTAAYEDLLSTGNLRVIDDRGIRDAIIRFYESVELAEVIVQNNNDVFLDRQLLGTYFGQGMIFAHTSAGVGDRDLDEGYELMRQRLGEDFVHQPDPMWNFQPSSREWQVLRSLLLNSAQIHIIGEIIAGKKIIEARELLDSIETWLSTNQL